MKPTGQCLKDFEKWFINKEKNKKENQLLTDETNKLLAKDKLKWFHLTDFSMQYGVLVDFYDSVGIHICLDGTTKEWYEFDIYDDNGKCLGECITSVKTRQEAREQAINKANEINNNKNK